jgi:hypothetical protein
LISLVPKKAKSSKRRAFYKSPPPKRVTRDERRVTRTPNSELPVLRSSTAEGGRTPKFIATAPFTLREDGSIGTQPPIRRRTDDDSPSPGGEGRGEGGPSIPKLIFSSDTPFVRLYHGNCLELLDAIAAKYPDGRFDAIFADPPYFFSNPESFRGCQRMLKPDGTIWQS